MRGREEVVPSFIYLKIESLPHNLVPLGGEPQSLIQSTIFVPSGSGMVVDVLGCPTSLPDRSDPHVSWVGASQDLLQSTDKTPRTPREEETPTEVLLTPLTPTEEVRPFYYVLTYLFFGNRYRDLE